MPYVRRCIGSDRQVSSSVWTSLSRWHLVRYPLADDDTHLSGVERLDKVTEERRRTSHDGKPTVIWSIWEQIHERLDAVELVSMRALVGL